MIEMADDRPLPMAVVAHSDHGYLGSAFLIHSDMEERPQYSPWVAAVWVEAVRAQARRRSRADRRGREDRARPWLSGGLYLLPAGSGGILRWESAGQVIEQAVGAKRLSVLKLDLVEKAN